MKPIQITRRRLMQWIGAGFASSAAPAWVACTRDEASPAATPAATPAAGGGSGRSDGDEIRGVEGLPSREELFGWIEEICRWGIRRPGYPAAKRAEDFLAESFESIGLENVRREPVPTPVWEPREFSLSISSGDDTFEIDCFPLPHSACDVDLTLELARFDPSQPESVAGRAALVPLALAEMSATTPVEGGPELAGLRSLLRDGQQGYFESLEDHVAQAPGTPRGPLRPTWEPSARPGVDARGVSKHPGGTLIDPRDTLANERQTLPFTPLIMEVMAPAQGAGAAAFIGVLRGHPGDVCNYYVPYDGVDRPFPGVWIRESDGERLSALLAQGGVTIALRVQARRETELTYNIVGDLPGADDEVVLIGSHHDAPWASAVEDASGMALVLAQARYWASRPRAERPHRLRFLLQAGHMAGLAGGLAYLESHSDELDEIVLEIHLEHTAEQVRGANGVLEATGEPEPRWFFTSRNPNLEEAVIDALVAESVDRSLVLAPDTFGHLPPTDGGAYHAAGVPIVNFLTAPLYLFDSLDTPERIHQPSLEAISRATIRIVQSTASASAASMRDGIRTSEPPV